MIRALWARRNQGHRTMAWPNGPAPALPARFRGRPAIDPARCVAGCTACETACPTDAISVTDRHRIDLGRCLFCTECVEACPEDAIHHERDHRLSVHHRDDLSVAPAEALKLAHALESKILRVLGRSLKLRQVSAGGCNGCESDVNVLSTIGWDLSRFGIQMVASPRHADGLLVTGCISENMREALLATYAAMPDPKIVIAVGACAISGGPFAGHPQQHDGVTGFLPVDLFIPGCPPHPLTMLDGLLRLIDRLPQSADQAAE
ncbi:MAG: 4Fe-4S binding protein [Candidatus Hydrogenedentes bacterium]|nr:4Fe-4S binding protein [Candidatus Hydrogenedentota bacterium]